LLKTRIISSIVGLILLITVIALGKLELGAAIFILSLVALYEFYNSVSNIGLKPVKFIGYISCIPIIVIGLNGQFSKVPLIIRKLETFDAVFFGLIVLIFILFALIIFQHKKYNINDIAITLFGIFYVTFLFSYIVLIRNFDRGYLLIWLVFIGAWATDTFAYFSGRLFGKTKLIPDISPKKTVAGSVGGILGCILVMYAYGMIFLNYIPSYHFVIMGILCGTISQIGDLAASSIKRYVGVKDYGNIMPGHGGILDRFDSILFVAPVIYFYLSFIS
jgi:phosphatidate cytidylyltransferase